MKKLLLIITLTGISAVGFAQSNKELYQNARTAMLQGDLDNAVVSYNALLKQDPDNIDALNDYCYLLVLEKQYPKAIELGKIMIAKPKADFQSYQTLGLAYKGKGDYKEAEALYKEGLKKFADVGILYNEYGELFAMQNKYSDAILQWEAGIKADPNYSKNYYNAAMYYSKIHEDLFLMIQYGEIFINLESYSDHTGLIKVKLLDAYKRLFTGDKLDQLLANPTNKPFQKAWLQNISLASSLSKGGIDAEVLGAIRTRFILNWFNTKQNEVTPFHLFDHHQYMIKEGLFDAYNQWIFGEVSNPQYYQMWLNTHSRELSFFKVYQQNKLYRQPSGEYYK